MKRGVFIFCYCYRQLLKKVARLQSFLPEATFIRFLPIIVLMGKSNLKCLQPTARAVYDYLIRHESSRQLDAGFRKIDFRNASNHKGNLLGAGDGKVSCEELWENGLIILDDWGWKKEDAKKYQELRRLIETQTRRPIPWVFEAPTVGVPLQRQQALERTAHKIRQKVQGAIDALEKILASIKEQDTAKYKRCLIASLYWFVLVGEDGKGVADGFEDFLKRQKINQEMIYKIMGGFSNYLQNNGGGLGLANIGYDAKFEATALEAALEKRGWCTEQSKVMYAVLRMAGIEAFFVEPQLSVEYSMAKNRQPRIPLLGHMASGVGVKIIDEKGKEKIWIVDAALKLLEADYIEEKAGQWEAHPYWELSLRHFYMADLTNLGKNKTDHGKLAAAEQSLGMALQLGEDSTAFHAMGNYAYLLSKKGEKLSRRSKGGKKNYDQADAYSKLAIAINPYDPTLQFNRGQFLLYKHTLGEAVESFLQSIDADPRFLEPYQKLGNVIYDIHQDVPDEFSDIWKTLEQQMHEIATKHPKLKGVIKKGLEEMQKTVLSKKQSGKELVDLIEKLKRDLKLWLD